MGEWGYTRQSSTSTYFNSNRYNSFVYCGLRTTQAWEDTLTNNVPWVALQYTPAYAAYPGNGMTSGANSQFPHNQVAALMHTLTNDGTLNATRGTTGTAINPCVIATTNGYNQNYFDGFTSTGSTENSGHNDSQGPTNTTSSTNYSISYTGNRLDGPLWNSRNKGAGGNYSGHNGTTQNIIYKPVVDPTTGVLVPPAVPITISRSFSGDWTAGGQLRGLYKSLSGTGTFMKKYWLSPTQTFTVNGEPYLPFVVNQDMFLVRFA